jgi:hypothetical protein
LVSSLVINRMDHALQRRSALIHTLCFSVLLSYAAYDPSNPRFQQVSSFFWDRYSQELDSWRDQPLWSYSLHHFKVKPVVLYKWGTRRDLFTENLETRGFGGHIHDESNDKDASDFRGNQAEKRAVQ